jgi:hypothetical protein
LTERNSRRQAAGGRQDGRTTGIELDSTQEQRDETPDFHVTWKVIICARENHVTCIFLII